MALTTLLRFFLAREFYPFSLKKIPKTPPPIGGGSIGLYLHIPFCKLLCPFCPYYRVVYDRELVKEFKEALLQEIKLLNPPKKVEVVSVYFGGGSPALLLPELPSIIGALREKFLLVGPMGIELHPKDVTTSSLQELSQLGFQMVSLGVQSFRTDSLKTLGREAASELKALEMVGEAGFKVIDVDLIFGIPGQTLQELLEDFHIAYQYGATQISTYPFIDFSYTQNRDKPLGRREKGIMLKALVEGAASIGLLRTSVWTFARPNTPCYSSITRDHFLGLGQGAASLLDESFRLNTFSLKGYLTSLQKGIYPVALAYTFTPQVRALYQLFWSIYRLSIPKELLETFSWELEIPRLAKWWRRVGEGGEVTERGAYLFHLVEQHYTHRYLDKTWRQAQEEAWPHQIILD